MNRDSLHVYDSAALDAATMVNCGGGREWETLSFAMTSVMGEVETRITSFLADALAGIRIATE